MKSTKVIPPKMRRSFDETFKREAVNNWLNSNKSAAVIAEELGLDPGRLHVWKKRFAPNAAPGAEMGAKRAGPADLQSLLDEALRENRHLREQREILKKTLGILSEPPINGFSGLKQ